MGNKGMPIIYKTVQDIGLKESTNEPILVNPSDWRKDPMTILVVVSFIILTATNLTPLLDIWVKDPQFLENVKQTINVITAYLGVASAWAVRVLNINSPITFKPNSSNDA